MGKTLEVNSHEKGIDCALQGLIYSQESGVHWVYVLPNSPIVFFFANLPSGPPPPEEISLSHLVRRWWIPSHCQIRSSHSPFHLLSITPPPLLPKAKRKEELFQGVAGCDAKKREETR